jgi:glycosyltransferase involved in cell wall biosynthesis
MTHNCQNLIREPLYGWPSPVFFQQPPLPLIKVNDDQIPSLKISIVIPTLNQGDTIEDTICSIINQDYPYYEIIVMDGGSNDSTLDVIKRYKPYLAHVTSAPDKGQSQAINRGFQRATGDIFAWLNSDDYYLPGALAKVAETFSDRSVEFLVGAGDVISLEHKFLRYIPERILNREALIDWKNDRWIMQQSCFWRSGLWKRVGGVDESLGLLMDYDLWFKFSSSCQPAALDHKLGIMRYYPETKTVKFRSKTNQELAYVYAKHGLYDELKELVASLAEQNSELEAQLSNIKSSLPVRLLKRLHLFPSDMDT